MFYNLRYSFDTLTEVLMKLQACLLLYRLYWQVAVIVSEVLACNHLKVCPHREIRSDTHTLYQFLSG
jgi:hypothetical protein